MNRKKYTKEILEECLEKLKSVSPREQYMGIVHASYLIEQAFKFKVKSINPLLYYEHRNLSEKMEIKIIKDKLIEDDKKSLKSISAAQSLSYIIEIDKGIQKHQTIYKTLFNIRNEIVHSLDDISWNHNAAVDIAVTALKGCEKYIIKQLGIKKSDFNPLSSSQLIALQSEERQKRIDSFIELLSKHKAFFNLLSKAEVASKTSNNYPKLDSETWIEETHNCPACSQFSLDKIGMVDFDWSHGETNVYGTYSYRCRVCELILSEFMYENITLNNLKPTQTT